MRLVLLMAAGTDRLLVAAFNNGYLVLWQLPSLDLYCIVDSRSLGKGPQQQGKEEEAMPWHTPRLPVLPLPASLPAAHLLLNMVPAASCLYLRSKQEATRGRGRPARCT